MIRNFGLMVILLLILSASISSASAQDAPSGENSAATQLDMPTASDDVQGIWKAFLGEKEIIMAVNRSAQSLFGLAKFEGDNPWNGAVAGSISDNEVFFSLAALESETLASICISATLEGETMKGFFVRSDNTGKASRGDFSANMISPDTSGYSPATIKGPIQEDEADQMADQISEDLATELPASEAMEKPVSTDSESRFKDVTRLAKGINPDILPRMAQL